ncbi:MAG TPA: transketolase C-terminal domain-containing protein, partial [Ignavibacteriaceae bacterium]|nr:transketolase C-terminal domain-containing protein [Ignavibacteriaceae bacterium]
PGFLSDGNGPTHQAIEDISLMRTIPPMNVFCPSDEEDMLSGLKEIILHPSPFYVRYNDSKPAVKHDKDFKIGKAEVIKEGRDVIIFTYGILLRQAIEAADILRSEGRSVGIVNMRTLKPIDEEIIKQTCRRDVLLVTLEDHFITGGLYSIIAELLFKNRLRCNVFPITLENKWFKPAMLSDVLDYEGFTAEKIAGRINEELIKLSESKVYSI